MPATRTLQVLAVCAAAMCATACGQSSTGQLPSLDHLPLTTGARIVADVRSCDHGANAYCSLQLVVDGRGYPTSMALLASEKQLLESLGWTTSAGDSGVEMAADSPGHKLRLTIATATDDLKGIDLGWVQRRAPITRALSTAMFDRGPALSLMLETGSS